MCGLRRRAWDSGRKGYPLQLAAFEIIAAQNGRFGTLFNQFGELLVAAGVPDANVEALVGQESSAISHRCTHVGKEALAQAEKTLSEI